MTITDKIDKRMKELEEDFSVEQGKINQAQKLISTSSQKLISMQGEYMGLKRLKSGDRPNNKKALKVKKK